MEKYIAHQILYGAHITTPPDADLGIIIVIPCFNEPDIIRTLNALYQCTKPNCAVEIIVVVNSASNATVDIKQQNFQTNHEIYEWFSLKESTSKFQCFVIHHNDLPPKHAGVGLARKIGMDEAVRRFYSLRRANGIVACFDADSLCDTNYLVEIERFFIAHPQATACSIYFEHPLEGSEYSAAIYNSIVLYELYLRYYVDSLRYIGFPYSYQTVGSSFAVRAEVYVAQGGMNKRQAGEDFYFLQKIIPHGNYHNLNTTRVIPSPRPSLRVPFGTGKTVQTMLENGDTNYETYHFDSFLTLASCFAAQQIEFFYSCKDSTEIYDIMNDLPEPLSRYLSTTDFVESLVEMKKHSPVFATFHKRFFQWFNAFRVLKYLNFAHETYFTKIPVGIASAKLIETLTLKLDKCDSLKEKLHLLRKFDRDN